jgi:hypothetical protein
MYVLSDVRSCCLALVYRLSNVASVVHDFGNAFPVAPPAIHAVKQHKICRLARSQVES